MLLKGGRDAMIKHLRLYGDRSKLVEASRTLATVRDGARTFRSLPDPSACDASRA